jgi:hypothetical protein
MLVSTKLAAATLVLLAGFGPAEVRGAEEGIALAIIYDTSGSMKEAVPDAVGGLTSKYIIANRALRDVTRQLQAAATNTAQKAARHIQVGLFTFQGDQAHEVVQLGPLDAPALENWAAHFSRPHGNTPLGNALTTAAHAVLKSPLARKHVLVITDGVNTAGPTPQAVLPGLKKLAGQQGMSLSVHFVAFDVDARQFAAVKRQGATVVGAADEKQLNSQLDFILQQKILLEDEEPAKVH